MNLETIVEWEDKLAIRRTFVLGLTLWLTYRSFVWGTEYAALILKGNLGTDGLAAAAIIAAVLAPVTYLQKVVFDSYIASKPSGPLT